MRTQVPARNQTCTYIPNTNRMILFLAQIIRIAATNTNYNHLHSANYYYCYSILLIEIDSKQLITQQLKEKMHNNIKIKIIFYVIARK